MIYFDNLQVSSMQSTHNVKETVAGILEVAGIHALDSYEAPYLLEDEAASGVWSRDGNEWEATASGVIAVANAEGAVVVDLDIPDGGSVLFGNGDSSSISQGIGVKRNGGSLQFIDEEETVYLSAPLPVNDGRLRVVVNEVTSYRLEIEHKIVIVYQGYRFVAAQAFIREDDVSSELVFLKASGAMTFDLHIDEFARLSLSHSVDPGETPQAALNRAIQGLALNLMARYNGRAFLSQPRPGRAVDVDLSAYEHYSSTKRQYDYDARSSRVRAVSAYPEAEFVDRSASDEVGGQFEIVSNPNVITLAGASAEAERIQDLSDEKGETLIMEGPSCIVIEPGDLVTIDGEYWIADHCDRKIGTNGAHMSSVLFRKYTGVS